MSEKEGRDPGKDATRPEKGREQATNKKETPPDQPSDSEDIERAVYDGMQDLRVKKPK